MRAAELATILRFSGGLHLISGRIAVEVELDSPTIARRVRRDLAELYGVRSDAAMMSPGGIRRTPTYVVRVVDGGETLARQTGLLDARRRPVRGLPNRLTTGSQEELAAVWRGAFLAHGSLTDPGRSAALEITCPGNESAMALVGAAGRLGISAKAREVRGVHRVVIRDGEAISAMLRLMGATETRLRVGGAAPAPRGAGDREPPRELRRREPPTLGAGGRRRVRSRRARARDPR